MPDLAGKVALVGVLLTAAGLIFTAGAVFTTITSDLEALKQSVTEIDERMPVLDVPDFERRISDIEWTLLGKDQKYVSIKTKRFESYGEGVVERDGKVDKRYFADDSCDDGDIVVGQVNPPNTASQPAICFCSNGPEHGYGQGWYCID